MKTKHSLIILGLLLLFSLSLTSSTCTVTFDRNYNYSQLETITATMTCSEVAEKLDAYELNWTNSTGYQLELDTGTTPSQVDTNFFETFVIPSDYVAVNGTNITATLQGTDLEGSDSANISAAGTSSLIITGTEFSSNVFLGTRVGIQFDIEDENGKKMSNALCKVAIADNDNLPIETSLTDFRTFDGHGEYTQFISILNFAEGTDYLATVNCMCGLNGTENACVDEDGKTVINSIGSASGPFTTNTWLSVNTVTDKKVYNPNQEIFICVNVTNLEYGSRIPLHIYHQVRCSSRLDNNDDTDRALIISDDEVPSGRGIDNGTTQMQCKRFNVPDAPYLQGKTSQCYASTNVKVLNDLHEEIVGYYTTSPVFNVTFNNLQVYAKWERESEYKWNAIVNLSTKHFQDYSGSGTGNIQIHLAHPDVYTLDATEQYSWGELPFNNLLIAEQIDSITAYNLTEEISTALHFKKLGQLDLILEDVNISYGWYNVTINLNSFEERDSNSLEEIANETGTFRNTVTCPFEGEIGSIVTCQINSILEESQLHSEEVGYTCFLEQEGIRYSTIEFQTRVDKDGIVQNLEFLVPSTFEDNSEVTAICEVIHYDFGGRKDTPSDTFIADKPSLVSKIIKKVEEIIPDGILKIVKFVGVILLILSGICLILLLATVKRKRKVESGFLERFK